MLLAPGRGPDPAWLAERRAWWREREAGLRAHAPLDVEPPDLALSAEDHAQARTWLPLRPLVADVEATLRAWFDAALADLGGLDLRATDLGAWRSWLDARARLPGVRRFTLPSQLLAGLADPQVAHDVLFELAAPPSIGSDPGRYGERLAAVAAALRGADELRAWDVGCGTGEGTWALAHALAPRAAHEVVVTGTTPCPLQRLMAERRARPHDPAWSAALDAFVAGGPHPSCVVRFRRHDVLRDPPLPAAFDAIACHGLLGEGIDDEGEVARVVATLGGALAPEGVLSVTDRFRADRAARAAALVARAAAQAGLDAVGPGLFRRRTSAIATAVPTSAPA